MEPSCFFDPKKDWSTEFAAPSEANAITYECFRLYGGLANPRCYRAVNAGGRVSYHDLSLGKRRRE